MAALKDPSKLRRIYDDHVKKQTSPTTATARDRRSAELASGAEPMEPLPIADEFMRQSSERNREAQGIAEQHVPTRKSVPGSTIRRVPTSDAQPVYEDDEDDLAPAMERLDMGGSAPEISRSPGHSVANANADSPPRTGLGSTQEPRSLHKIPRRSLEKPLPSPPQSHPQSQQRAAHTDDGFVDAEEYRTPGNYDQRFNTWSQARETERKLGVEGVVDLSNTTETHIHERYAPAVTHETIREDVHEIVEEQITREIHQDHIYHRILPIEDIEVLPARHYVLVPNGVPGSEGDLKEVRTEDLPRKKTERTQRMIEKGLMKTLPKASEHNGRRQFTARDFSEADGDYQESRLPDGGLKTEKYWVHPPTLETGARDTGQTSPIYLP